MECIYSRQGAWGQRECGRSRPAALSSYAPSSICPTAWPNPAHSPPWPAPCSWVLNREQIMEHARAFRVRTGGRGEGRACLQCAPPCCAS